MLEVEAQVVKAPTAENRSTSGGDTTVEETGAPQTTTTINVAEAGNKWQLNTEDDESDGDDEELELWMIILIAVLGTVLVGVFGIGVIWVLRMLAKSKRGNLPVAPATGDLEQ
ncbi:MAG: hypothetical protein V2I33_26020 [Kangiellaceae bacterium]|nr:hypothetical protein [Kangiellaceae bacterium]